MTGTTVTVQQETRTANIGVRVVSGSHNIANRQKRGRPRNNVKPTSTMPRARATKQYQWSAASRDAYDVAQQNHQGSNSSRSDMYGRRFERGEGGGVTVSV